MRFVTAINLMGVGLLLTRLATSAVPPEAVPLEHERGQSLYQRLCVECHGANGEGVPGKFEEPLRGDWTVERLARRIHRTMPEDDPTRCEDEDATAVAAYLHAAFYSPAARGDEPQPRIELSRLTVRQYEESLADLIGSFRAASQADQRRGLRGEYFRTRNTRRDNRAFERLDPRIDFDFGEQTPDPEQITTNEFAIRWRGVLLAPETGDYQFILTTGNGARLWMNDDDNPLIDAWVSSGVEPAEHRAVIRLLGGRAYPLRLDCFKGKEKTAAISLAWHPPHGVPEIIPERCLSPGNAPATFVVTTPFPPDDSSVGYPRGTSVSQAWDEATTQAAIEAAIYVADHRESLAGIKPGADDAARKAEDFAIQFVERAFRRSLSEEEREFFVRTRFANAPNLETALKRIVLLALKSPQFLYPEIGVVATEDHAVAARLALALWDSLPDRMLRAAADRQALRTPEQIATQARRMLEDPRAKAKLQAFFHHWLQIDHAEGLAKDAALFPDFDEALAADLRTSLDLFLDQIAWSEQPDYRRLLLADHLPLNARLAAYYGVEPAANGEAFMDYSFAREDRAGVLTHPYLLSLFAYPRSTSPIHRGVFLTRNIVGRALKPPPMAIAFEDASFDPSLTMREKVAELTRPTACQACHSIINPLGFSLEHFDAVGRFRTTEGDRPVDATSDYETITGDIVRLTNARDLAEFAAGNPPAHRAFIEALFHQVAKQPVLAYGSDVMEHLHRSFVASGFNIQSLLVDIATIAAQTGLPPSQPGEQDT